MKEYVAGFLFDSSLHEFILIRKNRPDWQIGMLNGVGGKIYPKELPEDAMAREFMEETGVSTKSEDWKKVVTLHFDYANVHFYTCSNAEYFLAAKTETDEDIFRCHQMADFICAGQTIMDPLENIIPLLELSRQRLRDREATAPKKGWVP